MKRQQENNSLIKSQKRVADHGEVFTPNWLVEDMLAEVKDECSRIESKVLESACGAGNFLKPVLHRKLRSVQERYGKSDFEKNNYALCSLMSIYGIELLADNISECRESLLAIFVDFLEVSTDSKWHQAAIQVLNSNIIEGDALTLLKSDGSAIIFPEWSYLGKGKYQRRDFRYDELTQRSSIVGTLFELAEEHEIFVPVKTYPQMTVEEIFS